MTAETLAATLLRDVERHHVPRGLVLYETEVLVALSRALEPAIAEQAGEVLEGVTPGPWVYEYTGIGHTVRQPGAYNAIFTVNHAGNFEQDARFIAWCRESVPALLAQIAALRAERDDAVIKRAAWELEAKTQKARAEAAEAKVKKLRAERDDALAFLDNAVSKSPEPLKALGKYLAGRLDEDEWPTAEQYLNAAAKACADRAEAAETTLAAMTKERDAKVATDAVEQMIRNLRDCANGMGSFKTNRGDFGLCDDAADMISAIAAHRDALNILSAEDVAVHQEAISRAEAAEAERDALLGAVKGLVEVLDQHETKGPLPDTALMFCWLAAQNVRAVLRGYMLEKPE